MPSRKHHAIPVHYLSRFTAEDGLLWQYDRKTKRVQHVAPRIVGAENYLYSPEVGDDPKNDALEIVLAKEIDGPASALFAKIVSGSTLSDQDRLIFARHLAIQELRVPKARDAIVANFERIGDAVLRMAASRPSYYQAVLGQLGEDISLHDAENHCRELLEGKFPVRANKISWLRAMAIYDDIAKVIFDLPWALITSPDEHEFVTTDAPVVKILTDDAVPRSFAGGWLSPSAETTYALDPRHILVLRADGREGPVTVRRRWCRGANSRAIAQANRFVFARSRDAYILRILEKSASVTTPRIEIVSAKPGETTDG